MDFTSLLGAFGGGGGGGQAAKSEAAAQTIFGGYNSNQQLATLAPWLIGAAIVGILAVAAVVIAALRR